MGIGGGARGSGGPSLRNSEVPAPGETGLHADVTTYGGDFSVQSAHPMRCHKVRSTAPNSQRAFATWPALITRKRAHDMICVTLHTECVIRAQSTNPIQGSDSRNHLWLWLQVNFL